MLRTLLAALPMFFAASISMGHADDFTFYILFPGTEPVTGNFEASWTPGGMDYDITVSKTQTCRNPIFRKSVKDTTASIPALNPGTYFVCLSAIASDGHKLNAQNSPVMFTVR